MNNELIEKRCRCWELDYDDLGTEVKGGIINIWTYRVDISLEDWQSFFHTNNLIERQLYSVIDKDMKKGDMYWDFVNYLKDVYRDCAEEDAQNNCDNEEFIEYE